jgi:hypothetical protein
VNGFFGVAGVIRTRCAPLRSVNALRYSPEISKLFENRPYSAAAERNREPIFQVLGACLPAAGGRVLEIGGGTGQHARYFSARLPEWHWQPTDHPDRLADLRRGLDGIDRPNLAFPAPLDVNGTWPGGEWNAVFSANTAHIMAWPAVCSMFAGVAEALTPAGRFFLYGPFRRDGGHHAKSNAEFDASLRARPGGMGVRDLADLDRLAGSLGLERVAGLQLPANNHMLIFERRGS